MYPKGPITNVEYVILELIFKCNAPIIYRLNLNSIIKSTVQQC